MQFLFRHIKNYVPKNMWMNGFICVNLIILVFGFILAAVSGEHSFIHLIAINWLVFNVIFIQFHRFQIKIRYAPYGTITTFRMTVASVFSIDQVLLRILNVFRD